MLRRAFSWPEHGLSVGGKVCSWNGPRTYPTVAHVLACSAEAWYRVVYHGVMDELLLPSAGKTGTSCRRYCMLLVADGRKVRDCIEFACDLSSRAYDPRIDQVAMRDFQGFAETRASRSLPRGVRTRV